MHVTHQQKYCFYASFLFKLSSEMCARILSKSRVQKTLNVHCSNLVFQEVAREGRLMADTLNFVWGVSVVIIDSTKCKQLFQSCPQSCYFQSCRCIHRAPGETLEQNSTMRDDTQAKIPALCKQATQVKTYFGLMCSKAFFLPLLTQPWSV